MVQLRAADPELPTSLRNRAADNWRPLIAIADVAGGDWPELSRLVAEGLNAGRAEETVGVMLLSDLRTLFDGKDRLTSKEIVEALARMDHRPWPEWKAGKPMTERQLAKVLEPFGVGPKTIRTHHETAKGYMRDALADAFGRYLPPLEPSQRNR